MRTPAPALILLLLAALVAGAWWWVAADGREPALDGAPREAANAGAAERAGAVLRPVEAADTAERTTAGADGADLGAIDPERDLHGTVLGPAGAPIAGAEVTATASAAESYGLLDRALRRDRRPAGATVTASDGSYRLRLQPHRAYLVRAQAPGLVPGVRGGAQAGARVDFVLTAGAVLTGTVRAAAGNAAVPGTRIEVRQRTASGSLLAGSATTDGAGVYRIDGLPAGTCDVDVIPETLATPRDFDVELRAGSTTVHDVLLTEGLTIRGFVRDAATRAGLAGALVGEGIAGRTVRTGDDGAFALVGFNALANLSLRVHADGYAETTVELRGRGTTPPDTRTEVEILLHKGRAVRGVVHDAAGAPLGRVYVAATAADHRGEHDRFRSDWRSTFTGDDGAFAIADLRPDMPHVLLLIRPGFATAVYEFPADEAQRAEVDFGVIVLQPPASLRGELIDDAGKPIADYEVTLAGHNADRWRGRPPEQDGYRAIDGYVAERTCHTDDRGRFSFADLAAGTYRVQAPKFDSHETVHVECTVARAEAVTGVRIVLVRGLSIEGTVFVADGALPKCYCSIDPEDGQATAGDVEVRPDGTFRVGGLAAGNYGITVYPYQNEADRASGRSYEARTHKGIAAGSTGLRLEVPVRGLVRGTLVDALRAPVVGAWVAVLDGEEVVESVQTAADGAFQLPAPVGRTVRVMACAPLQLPPGATSAFQRDRVVAQQETMVGRDPVELTLPAR